jgi:hypothetical protein
MCDYSQQLAARRLCTRRAMVGDELTLIHLRGVFGFAKWLGTRWSLTCIRHGSEVAFERRQVLSDCRSFVECDNGERILVNDIMPKEARFTMVPGGGDGFEFSNGLVCGMSAITYGASIKVLQLPAPKQRKRKPTMVKRARVRELQAVER